MIDNYKVKKTDKIINSGWNASFYKIKIGNKYYGLRREKIFEEDAIKYDFKEETLLENTESNHLPENLYRIIYNNLTLYKINKIHFVKLYDYRINKCKFKQQITTSIMNCPDGLERHNKLMDSEYCFDMLVDLKDGDLLDILYKMTQNQLYSMIIQCLYGLYLMSYNGFYHFDLNNKNFLYQKTNKKSIKIFNLNIPTFGFIWSIIDFGKVLHINFKLSDSEYSTLNYCDLKKFNNLGFLENAILHNDKAKIIINKIMSNIDVKNDIYYDVTIKERRLRHEEVVYYVKNVDNTIKLVKYFYKLIK